MNGYKKKSNKWIWFWAVLIIVAIIVIYIISLGSINFTDEPDLPKEFKDSRDEALKRHDDLSRKLAANNALKIKLRKRFNRVYVWVRIALVALWLIPLGILYHFDVVKNVEDALNYSEGSLIMIFTFNFITFGTLADLKDFMAIIKTKVENWIWRRNINLEGVIETQTQELDQLATSIDAMSQLSEVPVSITPRDQAAT